jgi:hypothetical protein
MSVLTLYYIIADFIFLVTCIISNMMRAYEKKSSVQSIGKGGSLSSTDVAIEMGIFECLERAAEESSRDIYSENQVGIFLIFLNGQKKNLQNSITVLILSCTIQGSMSREY